MLKILPLVAGVCLAGLASSATQAQASLPLQEGVPSALEMWQATHGEQWRLTGHSDLTTGRFLWGGTAAAVFTPRDEQDWFELARQAFDQSYDIFQIADLTLEPVQVKFLTLSTIGSSDKVAVEFRQLVRGVPVRQATVHALFTPKGELLALDSTAIPGVEKLQVRPLGDRYAAVDTAMNEYMATEGREPSFVGQPELLIVKTRPGKLLEARLSWAVELRNDEDLTNPAARRIYVAADGDSRMVLESEQLIHHQVSGHVDSYATPGTRAHSGSNPPTLQPMRFMTVTSAAGNATTDENGDFSLNSANVVNVTARYVGPWANVINNSGANHTVTQSFIPGVPGTITMNSGQSEIVTSEASCFDSVNDFHSWVKAIDPSDRQMDFQVLTNANIGSTCNAFYNGSSINMYRSGGGCNNTGYSTVVAHEEGHWANDRYSSGNGSDGFGEGNADVYAMYIYDTPVVGADFFTGGGFIRTGLNTRQFCGDNNGGCYGEVHNDGEVLMGAMWKVRDRLNQTLGNAGGDLTADTLMVAWMNAYNDRNIKNVIEEHWLVLDDDDGNIFNGTPNFGDIDGGFRAQGFDGVAQQAIQVVHTPLGNSLSEAGPYVVDAAITSLIGNVITAAEVVYSVDGGTEATLAMNNLGGGNWRTGIPGQLSPATVSYHIVSHDSGANTENEPYAGDFSFLVGQERQVYFNDFEGASDEGWTHGTSLGVDEWERGTPSALSEDPGAAANGLNSWGTDLLGDGAYASDSDTFLASPLIDCSGQTAVHLRFSRWLTVEASQYDRASIEVNGQTVWENSFSTLLRDDAWSTQVLDISALADNNSAVEVRFLLSADDTFELGGWNIDDFELFALAPVPGGANALSLLGDTIGFRGHNVTYTIYNMEPGAQWVLLAGTSNAGSVIMGRSFDIGTPNTMVGNGSANASGSASVTISIPNSIAPGTTGYFEAGALGTLGVEESNLLSILIF